MPHRLRRLGPVLPALAAAVFGIVRLPELTRSPLWFDELFSLDVVSLPFGDSMRRIIADHTNPPLFYVLLKGWLALGGDGDLWARLLPCLFALLLGPALVWLAREARAGTLAGTLAVALAAASPLTVDLANEVRAYSLLALLACLSLAGALRARRLATPQAFALVTILNVALVHTHYFGWLTVAAEVGTAMLCWSRPVRREMMRSASLTALVFLPWASAVISHALRHSAPLRNVAWIAPPDAAAPLWLFADLTGRWTLPGANLAWVAFAVVALGALAVLRLRERRPATTTVTDSGTLALLALAGLGAPLAVWGLSVVGSHSVWVPRYLLGSATPVALLTALAVTALPPRRAPVAALAGFVWAFVAFAALPQRAPVKFDWRRFVHRLDLAVGSPRDVVAFEAFTGAPLQRYAAPGMRLHMVHALDSVPVMDSWVVYRPESFANSSPILRLRTMGFTVVTSLTAESAGQRMVAVRVRP